MSQSSNPEIDHKHRMFILHYLATDDRILAYQRVYPDCTRESAESSSRRLLNRLEIKDLLSRVRDSLFTNEMMGAGEALDELSRIARTRITDVCSFDDEGSHVFPSDALLPKHVSAIQKIKTTRRWDPELNQTVVTQDVTLHNKVTALSKIMTFHGLDQGFDTLRRGLKNYGLALVRDPESETGWRLERHIIPNS